MNNHHESEPSFRKAVALDEDRRQGRNIPSYSYWPQALIYSDRVRYAEQLLQSVPVSLSDGPIDDATCAQLLDDFDIVVFDPATVQRVQLLINALGEGTTNNGDNILWSVTGTDSCPANTLRAALNASSFGTKPFGGTWMK